LGVLMLDVAIKDLRQKPRQHCREERVHPDIWSFIANWVKPRTERALPTLGDDDPLCF
jgi:hypothetical protein